MARSDALLLQKTHLFLPTTHVLHLYSHEDDRI